MLYLADEFEDERPIIVIGFVTLLGITVMIGAVLFRITTHHVCPLCGCHLGNRGDIVSRQAAVLCCVCFDKGDSDSCVFGLFPFSSQIGNMSSQKQEAQPLEREEDVKRVKVEGLSFWRVSLARNGKFKSNR